MSRLPSAARSACVQYSAR